MFSHITTTNRVRAHEFLAAAAGAGFAVIQSEALARVDVNYLRQVKPHLLERYRSLADQELGILHLLLVLEKPG